MKTVLLLIIVLFSLNSFGQNPAPAYMVLKGKDPTQIMIGQWTYGEKKNEMRALYITSNLATKEKAPVRGTTEPGIGAQWYLEEIKDSDGYFSIKNAHSKMYLSVYKQKEVGTQLYLTKHPGKGAMWKWEDTFWNHIPYRVPGTAPWHQSIWTNKLSGNAIGMSMDAQGKLPVIRQVPKIKPVTSIDRGLGVYNNGLSFRHID